MMPEHDEATAVCKMQQTEKKLEIRKVFIYPTRSFSKVYVLRYLSGDV